MRVAFSNLGCKLNQAELERMARDFAAAGHQVVADLEEADVHVVNSCTVTHAAARDSRKTARRASRRHPGSRTVLTGCYVESDPAEAAALAGVDLVVPNAAKEQLLTRVEAAFPEITTRRPADDLPYMPLAFGNARTLVKIEDGCNMQCSFCIIPATRGPQRSRHPREVVREVQARVDEGHPEVVVTGVQISSYQHGDLGLYELTARLLEETTAPRLRLSSIAPWQFDPRLLDLFDSGRLCRHFHLSLQSGCDATLRRMRRPYSTTQFEALVGSIRERLPGLAVTTDVIVGFPGETEEEFADSLAFTESIGFARLHAFPYSVRPGTTAAELPDRVEPPVLRERMHRMLAAGDVAASNFAAGQVGETVEVLWEARHEGCWRGTSDNYLRVEALSARRLDRQLVATRLTETQGSGARGELVEVA